MNVLIAEDDPTSSLLLRKSLEKLGHTVVAADDGGQAWQKVSQPGGHDFHLLITDWMMPEMDGMELLRNVRSVSSASGGSPSDYLYVIMLTAKGRPEDRLMAMQAGADDFLIKPLDQGDLVARLEVARRILTLQQDVKSREAQAEARQTSGKGMGGSGTPLGEVLVTLNIITPDQLKMALDQQQRTGQVLGMLLIANGWATEEDIVKARAFQVEMPYVDVANETPDRVLLAQVSRDTAQMFRMLPLSIAPSPYGGGEIVRVALANPWQMDGLDTVQRLVGKRATPYLASADALDAAIERAYRDTDAERSNRLLTQSLAQSEAQMAEEAHIAGNLSMVTQDDLDAEAALVAGGQTDEAPVIRLVNALLVDAVRRRASDIHVEPYKTDFEVRYRIDGDLQVVRTLPRATLAPVLSRLKVMAELDIAERRVPQDGRIALKVDGRGVDLRVSTLPVQFGERIVMRVLDRASVRMTLDELEFSTASRNRFEQSIKRPHGIILVTGPTGSGKTTTLYASLNALRAPSTNIMTCEDPVEYELDRIGQSAVNVKAGLTFAAQLRAILRQDPDVVLVGEIRDGETAETAFRAALTGHLVLSTLHCNEAAGAPTRLVDMGVAPYLIASALSGVVAQRLLRRICPACKTPYTPEAGKQALWATMAGRAFVPGADTLFRGAGCPECDRTGVRGRVAVHEVMSVTDAIQAEIMANAQTSRLRELALADNMTTLLIDGLQKAAVGLTTMDDVQKKLFAEGVGMGAVLPAQSAFAPGIKVSGPATVAVPAPAPLPIPPAPAPVSRPASPLAAPPVVPPVVPPAFVKAAVPEPAKAFEPRPTAPEPIAPQPTPTPKAVFADAALEVDEADTDDAPAPFAPELLPVEAAPVQAAPAPVAPIAPPPAQPAYAPPRQTPPSVPNAPVAMPEARPVKTGVFGGLFGGRKK